MPNPGMERTLVLTAGSVTAVGNPYMPMGTDRGETSKSFNLPPAAIRRMLRMSYMPIDMGIYQSKSLTSRLLNQPLWSIKGHVTRPPWPSFRAFGRPHDNETIKDQTPGSRKLVHDEQSTFHRWRWRSLQSTDNIHEDLDSNGDPGYRTRGR